MSTTTTTHETVSEASTDDHSTALATIVAQTTSTTADLPDFEVFSAACDATRETIEDLVEEL